VVQPVPVYSQYMSTSPAVSAVRTFVLPVIVVRFPASAPVASSAWTAI
jgi:hypothetical protein